MLKRDNLRQNLIPYSRKAFSSLPSLSNPQILDIGSGSGVVALELLQMTDGLLTAIDTDPSSLELFREKLKLKAWEKRVKIIYGSILDTDFPENVFDIIWSEGSVNILGFKKSLNQWYPWLKYGGFLVIHDDLDNYEKKKRSVKNSGFELIDHFILSNDIWWKEYYQPLEKLINGLSDLYPDNHQLESLIDQDKKEIELCRTGSIHTNSFFMILKKI